MGIPRVTHSILWQPYEIKNEVDWPAAVGNELFWYRRHYDEDNILGPYLHYSSPPTCDEINLGWGINQIIAAGYMLQDMHNYTFVGYPDYIMPAIPGSMDVGPFPTSALWEALKAFIVGLRDFLGLSAYSWSLPYESSANFQKRMVGKNKVSFVDLTEFRDALNDIPTNYKPTPVTVKTTNMITFGEEWQFQSVSIDGGLTDTFDGCEIDASTRNKYNWSFTNTGSSLTGTVYGSSVLDNIYWLGVGEVEIQKFGGKRFIFQLPLCFKEEVVIKSITLKCEMSKPKHCRFVAEYSAYKPMENPYRYNSNRDNIDTVIHVFTPTKDPALLGLDAVGELGDPNINVWPESSRFYSGAGMYGPRGDRRYRFSDIPKFVNGSRWLENNAAYDQFPLDIQRLWGSNRVVAFTYENVDVAAWRATTFIFHDFTPPWPPYPYYDPCPCVLTIGGVDVIHASNIWLMYFMPVEMLALYPADRLVGRALLFGQDDPEENGLWEFSIYLTSTGPRCGAGKVDSGSCFLGSQWYFSWPSKTDGRLWWLTDQPPDAGPSSSLSSDSSESSLSSLLSCSGSGFSFRPMTDWEMRYLDIWDLPLLGGATQVGSFDMADMPEGSSSSSLSDEPVPCDVNIKLTNLPAWINTCRNSYFMIANDIDLNRPPHSGIPKDNQISELSITLKSVEVEIDDGSSSSSAP